MVIWVKQFQIELMVEIYSSCLVRAIGKVFLMTFFFFFYNFIAQFRKTGTDLPLSQHLARTPIKHHKGDEK